MLSRRRVDADNPQAAHVPPPPPSIPIRIPMGLHPRLVSPAPEAMAGAIVPLGHTDDLFMTISCALTSLDSHCLLFLCFQVWCQAPNLPLSARRLHSNLVVKQPLHPAGLFPAQVRLATFGTHQFALAAFCPAEALGCGLVCLDLGHLFLLATPYLLLGSKDHEHCPPFHVWRVLNKRHIRQLFRHFLQLFFG